MARPLLRHWEVRLWHVSLEKPLRVCYYELMCPRTTIYASTLKLSIFPCLTIYEFMCPPKIQKI